MVTMGTNDNRLMVGGRSGIAAELDGNLSAVSPAATLRPHRQDTRYFRTGFRNTICGLCCRIGHKLAYIVGLSIVLLFWAQCVGEDRSDPDTDCLPFARRHLCKFWEMKSLSSARSWLTFASSLLNLAAARGCRECSTPNYGSKEASSGTDAATYTDWTVSAIQALQSWYNESTGLWDTTGWWNSANCLTVLGDFYALDSQEAAELDLNWVFSNTFIQAQQPPFQGLHKDYITTSTGWRIFQCFYTKTRPNTAISTNAKQEFVGFINNYYDDEGWWALAWIRAYDVTGDTLYLSMAESIFADMVGGVNGTCGGGIWWSKDKNYKNAIANELYLTVAASLANRVPYAHSYLTIAEDQWEWFYKSGMINSQNLINDGLDINSNGTCTNNGKTTWTYNQGVILGGLVELYKANGNAWLLTKASNIAEAAMNSLSVDGILHEPCEDDCGADGSQFKG